MGRNVPLLLVDESESFEPYQSNGMEIVHAQIDIYGKPLQFHIAVANELAKLFDIVPLAYSISDKLSLAVANHFESNNQNIPCHKGCSHCCNYLVALSLPEVFYLHQQMRQMETGYRTQLLQSCCSSAERILEPNAFEKHHLNQKIDLSEVSNWYSELGLSCPFLSSESCSIYDQRPLACREHMVISSSSCQVDNENEVKIAPLPVSILEVLGQLSADLEETKMEAVILSLALIFRDENYIQRSERTWPAMIMAEHFVHLLETMSQKNRQKFTVGS